MTALKIATSLLRTAIVAFCTLSLAGCVTSSAPILTDAKPLFGPKLRLQLYALNKGLASEPEQVNYIWDGKLYTLVGGGKQDVRAFSVHPFEGGDYILQDVSSDQPTVNEYAVMHPLADGVYLVRAIDENDADAATRAADCGHTDKTVCRVATRAQLFTLARATAARHRNEGGLVIRLEEPSPAAQPIKP